MFNEKIYNLNNLSKEKLLSLIKSVQAIDKKKYYKIAESRLNRLIKPKESLGRLEKFVCDVVAITENKRPVVKNKYVCVFAGDHGVAFENVSAFKQEVTAQMVANFLTGGAAINTIANSVNAKVVVADVGVNTDFGEDFLNNENFINAKINKGTNNIYIEPAMSYDDALKSLYAGINIAEKLIKEGANICSTGDMGIANTTPSSAIVSFYSGVEPKMICGYGTGVDRKTIYKKVMIIEKAIKHNIIDKLDPISVLSGIGGFEIGAIAGFIIGCALKKTPVVVDGFISTAGAVIAAKLNNNCLDYMFLGHLSKEKGHKTAVALINKKPILNLDMHLGEGTGAVLAMKIIEASMDMYNNMLTFDEADVIASNKNK
ncbi:MAG: nicotinate-nucleotide--dimethylbenzimidazole phosphoribosyltransferase [Deltaproteobacteria bacterium]|nr:nicotinate-nucleotide--dimethylbenzimidazole phosphoribosyltransferase [Deltaproteobacteria bacterium]